MDTADRFFQAVVRESREGAASVTFPAAWLEWITALDHHKLERLAPLLGRADALDTLQAVVEMLPALADPALRWAMRQPRDECMVLLFRLRTVAAFLESGDEVLSLEEWCRRQLVCAAEADPDEAARMRGWCADNLPRFVVLAPGDDGEA